MKKLLSMLITASMIFSTVAISASAEVTAPDGVTPAEVSASTVTTVFSKRIDSAPAYVSLTEQSNHEGNYFEDVNVNLKYGVLDVYVNASAAGTYRIDVIGSRGPYAYSSSGVNTLTLNDAAEATLKGGIGNTTGWAKIVATTWGDVTLNAGVNKLSFSTLKADGSVNTDERIGAIRIVGADTTNYLGVVPLELSADSEVAHYVTTATVDQPFINYNGDGTVLANSTAIGTFSKVIYDGVETCLIQQSRKTKYYVNAPVAGQYKVKFIGSGVSGGGYFKYSVNGGALSSNYTVGTEGWAVVKEIDAGTVTLNEGINTIQFSAPGQTAVRGLKFAGPAVVTLPDGATAYDISTAGDKVKYTFEAEDAGVSGIVSIMTTAPFDVYVNAAEAGDYYFTTYSQAEYDKTEDKNATVTVNNTNSKTITYGAGYNYGYAYTDKTPQHIKAVTFKVALKQGLNKISVCANEAQIRFDKFELRNYEIAGVTDKLTNASKSLYGTGLETTTTVASSPKVVTRSVVYDAIPADATTIDVSTLFVAGGFAAVPVMIASYDANEKPIDIKVLDPNALWNNFRSAQVKGLNVDGAATVKVMLFDNMTNLFNIDTETFTAAQ